jgi:hypothetical protein
LIHYQPLIKVHSGKDKHSSLFCSVDEKSFIPFGQGKGTLAYLVQRQLLIKTLWCKGQNTLAYFVQVMKKSFITFVQVNGQVQKMHQFCQQFLLLDLLSIKLRYLEKTR